MARNAPDLNAAAVPTGAVVCEGLAIVAANVIASTNGFLGALKAQFDILWSIIETIWKQLLR
jgi:hypothetical protein